MPGRGLVWALGIRIFPTVTLQILLFEKSRLREFNQCNRFRFLPQAMLSDAAPLFSSHDDLSLYLGSRPLELSH
jgi:hypothetical protein